MKVLHLIDTLGLGGAQRLLKNIMESRRGDGDLFLHALRRVEPCYEIDHPNVSVFPSSSRYSPVPLREVLRCIDENGIDILHCHLPRSIAFGFMARLLRRGGLKLIVQDHAEVFRNNPVFSLLLRLCGPEASAFVASSPSNGEALGRILGPHSRKIRLAYNFADPSAFNAAESPVRRAGARARWGIAEDEFVVGYAGRLAERKGWRLFAEAAAVLKHTPLRFAMAGAGPQEAELLRFLESNGLREKVRFLGYVADMPGFYSMLDCYVLPSRWEGMPMTLIEAMSMGVPVVCSRAPGIQEFVGDGRDALLIDPSRREDLAEKLLLLANEPALRRRLAAGAQETVARFASNGTQAALLSVYREAGSGAVPTR